MDKKTKDWLESLETPPTPSFFPISVLNKLPSAPLSTASALQQEADSYSPFGELSVASQETRLPPTQRTAVSSEVFVTQALEEAASQNETRVYETPLEIAPQCYADVPEPEKTWDDVYVPDRDTISIEAYWETQMGRIKPDVLKKKLEERTLLHRCWTHSDFIKSLPTLDEMANLPEALRVWRVAYAKNAKFPLPIEYQRFLSDAVSQRIVKWLKLNSYL